MWRKMVVYKVYFKDYLLKKGRLLGALSERRSDLRGESYSESGLRWARLTFGRFLQDKQSLFVVPQKLEEGDATRGLMEKEIFSEREFVDMMRSCALTGTIPIDTSVQRVEAIFTAHGVRLPGKVDMMTGSAMTPVPESIAALPAGLPVDLPVTPPVTTALSDVRETVSFDKFYGFSEKPFELLSDPKFFYFSPSHGDALAFMIDGIANQVGYISVTGEAGTGKTALIHFLLTSLGKKVLTVVIYHTPSNILELLRNILLQLGLETVEESEKEVRAQLHQYLIHELARKKTLVVVVDDAQDLSVGMVDELGKLLEEEEQLQTVFLGRREFEEKFSTQKGKKLWKGKGIRCRIRALNQKESKRYMDHRLRRVGSTSSTVFTPKALSMIVWYAAGIPRLINILCTQALLLGCDQGNPRVDTDVIAEVIKEVEAGHLLGLLRHRYGA
jgi:general secretion pathway protein A